MSESISAVPTRPSFSVPSENPLLRVEHLLPTQNSPLVAGIWDSESQSRSTSLDPEILLSPKLAFDLDET